MHAETDNAMLLKVEGLSQRFAVAHDVLGRPSQWLDAVDRVSLDLRRGETLGIVGESGCGKSTLARSILHLTPPASGRVVFDGVDLGTADTATLRQMRGRMQVVMQDPFSALNPRRSIGSSIGDGIVGRGRRKRVRDLLEKVGLSGDDYGRFPNEFSGGQRQRICIARALGPGPELLVADEAVSALDVSVQAQILNLLAGLRQDFGLSFLFISHNLSVVRAFCDRVAVMYLGRIVETGPTEQIFNDPVHPYTRALIAAVPIPVPGRANGARVELLPGDVPSPLDPPSGCRFRTRCPHANADCAATAPSLAPIASGREVACLRVPVLRRGPVWTTPTAPEAASC